MSSAETCLQIYRQCYEYEECKAAMKKTHHPECQIFSQLCTTNGAVCIPITSYASIQLKTV
ncbi:unnamed protein product [Paramecium pentaurelia]|uniref:Uncharacterized protein n=1 Tax=Paramecium pentaurelia TaxID=43138 RepID=A0A8S1XLG7_9CILI|nr:unnamed protein product [Paramecium pentaurelia]